MLNRKNERLTDLLSKCSGFSKCFSFVSLVVLGACLLQVGCGEPASVSDQSQTGDDYSSQNQSGQSQWRQPAGGSLTNNSMSAGGLEQRLSDHSANRFGNTDAMTILSQTVARYAAANSYQDKAILYLNYRLEGRPIQEPHPYSTAWDRQQRLSSRIFNGQLQCDGRLLSCYVFDIETANLDNQQMYLPAAGRMPVSQAYQDSIVRHFLGGYSELPLDEDEKDQRPQLIPAPMSLLTKQLDCGWIQQPVQAERQNDETVDDRRCYVVRSLFNDSTSDIWIDQTTGAIVQMSLPLKLLTREVITTGEIENVELMVKYHNATFDQPLDASVFAIKQHVGATPVRRFVQIPEAFPSELIGQTAPKFRLFNQGGKPVNRSSFDGKTTALLWLGGESSFAAVPTLSKIAGTFPKDQFHFAAVYSGMELAEPGSGLLQLTPMLEQIRKSNSLPMYYDQNLDASAKLKIKAIPTVVILDGNSKVQFARALSDDDWQMEVKAALARVQSGEDVAAEMTIEYERFMESYHQQLVSVSAIDLIDTASVDERPVGGGGKLVSSGFRNTGLQSKLEWSNLEFRQAGNVTVDDQSGAVFVFDGWRTVVELNQRGETVRRHELELPDKVAVSRLRIANVERTAGHGAGSGAVYAAFSVLGEQVYLFDQQWQPAGQLLAADFKHDGIKDAQFFDHDGDGVEEVVVAFVGDGGASVFEVGHRQRTSITKISASSIASVGSNLLYCNQTELGLLNDKNQAIRVPEELVFHKLVSQEAGKSASICALVSDVGQNWLLVGVDSQWQVAWRQPVGSQMFETGTESLAAAVFDSGIVFAVADVGGKVSLFSGDGMFLGKVDARASLSGVALANDGGQLRLLVATGNGLQSFRLNKASNILPVSNQR